LTHSRPVRAAASLPDLTYIVKGCARQGVREQFRRVRHDIGVRGGATGRRMPPSEFKM
jgi:hypothetical protein